MKYWQSRYPSGKIRETSLPAGYISETELAIGVIENVIEHCLQKNNLCANAALRLQRPGSELCSAVL